MASSIVSTGYLVGRMVMRFRPSQLRFTGLTIMCATLCLWSVPAQNNPSEPSSATSGIDIRGAHARPLHSITLDEIVSLREVQQPRLSPDGRRVAFLVRQAFRACNCYRTALYVV